VTAPRPPAPEPEVDGRAQEFGCLAALLHLIAVAAIVGAVAAAVFLR